MKKSLGLGSLLFVSLAAILAMNPACSGGGGGAPTCECPTYGVPQAMIQLPCETTPLPSVVLSGVCAGVVGSGAPLTFGATSAGTCHVELTYASGATYSADVQFGATPLACGDNPTGCGNLIEPVGLTKGGGGVYVLDLGSACTDGGTSTDASTDAAAE